MNTYPSKIGHYRDGKYRRYVKRLTTAKGTSLGLPVEESGTLYYIPDGTATTVKLPKISSAYLGIEYTFFVESNDSSVGFVLQTYDSSASIQLNFSSVVDNHTTVIPGSTMATGLRVTAMSSAIWMGQPLTANSYSESSDASSIKSGWTTG